MRLRRRRHVAPDQISVRELVAHGLSRHPTARGVYWPDSQITVCRHHIEAPHTRQLLHALRPPTDTATLLTGDELTRNMPGLCALHHNEHQP
jgi:hypothetical protein